MLEPGFFSRYDALGQQSQSLQGAPAALANAQALLQQQKAALEQQKAAIAYNIKYTKEQEDRIEACSTHWFYGNTALQPQLWFRGGTEGKIERAKAKLAKCNEERPGLEAAAVQLETVVVPTHEAEVERLSAAAASKAAADTERDQMRERACLSYPSPNLLNLQQQAAALQQIVGFEQANASIVHEVGNLCRQAADQVSLPRP